MPENHTISLFLTGRADERARQIWRSDSGTRLPTLCPDARYGLLVENGPRLVYSCTPESAEFVLGRLLDLLGHTPDVRFTHCLKCQVLRQVWERRSPEPDPVVRELEALNDTRITLPLDSLLRAYEREKTAAYAQLVGLVGQDEADRLLAGAEPDRTTPALDLANRQQLVPTYSPGYGGWFHCGQLLRAVSCKVCGGHFEAEYRENAVTQPPPDRTTPALDVTHDPTTALTRDELRTIDDKVAETVDGWTDYQCTTAKMLIEARGIDRDRAREIRRAEEAKVEKNGK